MSEKNRSAPPLTSSEIDDLVTRRASAENIHAVTDRVLATLVAQRDEIARLRLAMKQAYAETTIDHRSQAPGAISKARLVMRNADPAVIGEDDDSAEYP